jgi:rhodanese-related sulfurtransferase
MAEFREFAAQSWYLFVALVVVLGWLIGTEVRRKLSGVVSITPLQALQLINHQEAVVLDIRDGADYKAGHLPDARHIPANALAGRLGELQKFKDKPLIVYCRMGNVTGSVCALLKKNGFTAVHELSGGIAAWLTANLPVTKK